MKILLCIAVLLSGIAPALAEDSAPKPQATRDAAPKAEPAAKVEYDAALAAQLGADEHGMRKYVLVILKTGPTPLPKGEKRDAMFKGHFANMERLAGAGKLAYAGPLDNKDGWRGMFIFAVETIDEAKALAESDPVIINGEMIAEYHAHYGSAALMAVNPTHAKLQKTAF